MSSAIYPAFFFTVVLLRKHLLPVMQRLGAQIETHDDGAMQRFRRMHVVVLLICLIQLMVLVWGTIQLSLRFK